LCSKSRKNKIYQAFRELGRVIRTTFLLNYINNIEEKLNFSAFLNEDDIFLFFANPLLDKGYLAKDILALVWDLNLPHLKNKLEEYDRFQ